MNANAVPVDGREPPRWAVRVAHLVAVIALPAGLWRIGIALGFTMGIRDVVGAPPMVNRGVSIYIFGLTMVSEAVALLALGLVRPWGEIYPRWFPIVGGRRVPPAFATTVAATGAWALIVIWTFATVNFFALTVDQHSGRGFVFASAWWEVLFLACYAPLLLWGPLVLTITWAYHRRRKRPSDTSVARVRRPEGHPYSRAVQRGRISSAGQGGRSAHPSAGAEDLATER